MCHSFIHSLYATTQVPLLLFFLFFGADQLGIIYDNLIAYIKQIPNHLPPTPPKNKLLTKIQLRKYGLFKSYFGHLTGLIDPLTQHTKLLKSYYNWQKKP